MRLFDPRRTARLRVLLACSLLTACAAGCYGSGAVYVAAPAPVVTPVAVVDEEDAPASVTVFYERLSPYGEWIEIAPYGRVWRPTTEEVGEDFVPYGTGGTWVNSDEGWVFETDYAWGWAAFHYGRWFHHDVSGWVWLPDVVWGPAWVDWRYGDDYIGWVPLGPPGVIVHERHWIFVESRHFAHPHVMHYALRPERVHVAFEASGHVSREIVHGDVRWHAGPPADHVTRVTGRPVHTVHVNPPPAGTIRVRRSAEPTVAPSRRSPPPGRPSHPGRR